MKLARTIAAEKPPDELRHDGDCAANGLRHLGAE
jgi:hypothetical protein